MKVGEVLGEMGLLRSAPRSATVVANEAVELLPINWKMIKRLQWLYPPTARKFMYNLLEIICGRVERLTTCLSDVKVLDDATGLCNREHFIHLLDREMHRARRYEVPLSVGVLKIEFEGTNPGIDLWQREKILRSISEALKVHLRPYDILGRCDPQNFSLLFPQTSAEAAWKVCNRLRFTLEETPLQAEGVKPNIVFGLAEFKFGQDETPQALLNRAVRSLEQAKGLC
jgi:diguanylate cyclase (GGDEF)-like protein